MAGKPDHIYKDIQGPPPISSKLFYRRALVAMLIVIAGGMIAFAAWTLPSLDQAFSRTATFATFALVFAPTLLVMVALLLLLVAWWVGIDHGLWSTTPLNVSYKNIDHDPIQHAATVMPPLDTPAPQVSPPVPPSEDTQGPPPRLRHHFVRRTSLNDLQRRRKRQLYEGRQYRGKPRMADLARLSASLSQSASSPAAANEAPSSPQISSGNLSPRQKAATTIRLEPSGAVPSPTTPVLRDIPSPVEAQTPITIYMLKELVVEVQNAAGMKKTVQLRRKRREDGRYIERDLLAYLAARRGQPVGRDKLLEAVFAYGLSEEKYSQTNLTNQFNKCTQFLRKDINAVAEELGLPELQIIGAQREEWRLLTEECRVVDLDAVEQLFAMMEGISGEDFLRPEVQNACQALIDIYRGDFLAQYIEDIVREGGDDWIDNWMRGPYTAYRDKYFHALWYRAEFWRLKADLCTGNSDAELALQRNWYEQAASLYRTYALHVPTDFTHESAMLFDLKIRQRLSLAERALRACLDMYAATKNTQAGDTAYLTFARRMDALTQGRWKPRADTIEALKNVKEQTASHRFAPRVTPHDLSREEETRVDA